MLPEHHLTWEVKGGAACLMDLNGLEQRLLDSRGLSDLDISSDWHDPWLLWEMDVAVARIKLAIKQRERILIYGDYDVDGVSGTAQMILVLRRMGADVSPWLPHRNEDGYGLSQPALEKLLGEFDLLITVDCGVSNVSEVDWLNSKGKEVIVIDHHTLPEGDLPKAVAVIHPRNPKGEYPFGYLAAAGVVWKVCQALIGEEEALEFLDLTVLGTVADMVPLVGENRKITYFGLQLLAKTHRPGLRALLVQAGLSGRVVGAEDIAWKVAPMLNAPGKVDHAQPALDLLLVDDESGAMDLVGQLEAVNKLRRSLTSKIAREAEGQVSVEDPVIFAVNEKWAAGVVGLAAGKLARKYGKPAVVIGGNGKEAVGSARSPEGINVLNLLRLAENHVLKMGGHARAAGLSLEKAKVGGFKQALMAAADQIDVEVAPKMADAVVSSRLVSWEALDLIDKLAPFGEGNRRPQFVMQKVELAEWRPVGAAKDHAKCVLSLDGEFFDAIGFGLAEKMQWCGNRVDVLFSLEANEWQGRRNLQLGLVDIARSGEVNITSGEYEKSNVV